MSIKRSTSTASRHGRRLARRACQAAAAISMVSCCAILSGCAALAGDAAYSAAFRIKIEDESKLSPAERSQLDDIALVSPAADLVYVSTGKLTGLACKLSVAPLIPVWTWRPRLSETGARTPEEAAMRQLKLKAWKSGGNAVLSSSCAHNDSLDWSNNCFETWICTGEAVRVAEPCIAATCAPSGVAKTDPP